MIIFFMIQISFKIKSCVSNFVLNRWRLLFHHSRVFRQPLEEVGLAARSRKWGKMGRNWSRRGCRWNGRSGWTPGPCSREGTADILGRRDRLEQSGRTTGWCWGRHIAERDTEWLPSWRKSWGKDREAGLAPKKKKRDIKILGHYLLVKLMRNITR